MAVPNPEEPINDLARRLLPLPPSEGAKILAAAMRKGVPPSDEAQAIADAIGRRIKDGPVARIPTDSAVPITDGRRKRARPAPLPGSYGSLEWSKSPDSLIAAFARLERERKERAEEQRARDATLRAADDTAAMRACLEEMASRDRVAEAREARGEQREQRGQRLTILALVLGALATASTLAGWIGAVIQTL